MLSIQEMIQVDFSSNSASWKELFQKNGYLLISSVFEVEEIQEIREILLDILLKQGCIENIAHQAIAKNPPCQINSPLFYKIIQEILKKERFHDLAYHPKLLFLLRSLLKQEVYSHPNKMARIAYPIHVHASDQTPPHQDVYYVKGELDTFTTWIPLGNYGLEEGGLQVLEGSHLEGLYPIRGELAPQFRCAAAQVSEEDVRWRRASYKMGDVLIMHALTVHASTANQGSQCRLSLDCRFSAAKGIINEMQLLPPYYPHTATSWKELMQGWKDPERILHIPQTLEIMDSTISLETTLQRNSLFLGGIQ